MSNKCDVIDRRHVFSKCTEDIVYKVKRYDQGFRKMFEYDKKLKREIANSNERRRMQSINMGFETLKQLLPSPIEGEKLSKASILQLTAQYIQSLITRLNALEKEIACCKKTSQIDPTPLLTTTNGCLPLTHSVINSDDQNTKEEAAFVANDKICVKDCKLNSDNKETKLKRLNNRKRRLETNVMIASEHVIHDDASLSELNRNNSISDDNEDINEMNESVYENVSVIYCDESDPTETPGSLEHLVAAIEQVEGQQFYSDGSAIKYHLLENSQTSNDHSDIIIVNLESAVDLEKGKTKCSNITNSNTNLDCLDKSKLNKSLSTLASSHSNHSTTDNDAFSVIKPTISPYTEKIIFEYSQNCHMFDKSYSQLINNENDKHHNYYKRLSSDDSSCNNFDDSFNGSTSNFLLLDTKEKSSEKWNESQSDNNNDTISKNEIKMVNNCDINVNNDTISNINSNEIPNDCIDRTSIRRIPIPHKYLHRPDVIFQKYNTR